MVNGLNLYTALSSSRTPKLLALTFTHEYTHSHTAGVSYIVNAKKVCCEQVTFEQNFYKYEGITLFWLRLFGCGGHLD